MYCTLKKRIRKKDNREVYDVSLNRSVRINGNEKILSVHLFNVPINSLAKYKVFEIFEEKKYKYINPSKLKKIFPNHGENVEELIDELVEYSQQTVKRKLFEEHMKLKAEERKKQTSRENFYEEITVGEMQFFLDKGYRLLSKKYHPDISGDSEKFKSIKKCYDFLIEVYIKQS